MSKNGNSTTMSATNLSGDNRPGYQLKHRIAGAIVLMVLAVVVIPLLLSDPSLEANNGATGSSAGGSAGFKSRIVPLNINNVNKKSDGIDVAAASVDAATVSPPNDAKVVDDTRPALLDLTQSSETQSSETRSDDEPAQDQQSSAVVMTAEDKPAIKADPNESGQADPVVTEADEPAEETQLASAAPVDSNTNESGTAEAVKDGWVVRVGTYSKDANVVSVSSLLSKSGYEPNTTPVSTSLGPSTRVWLGPFAKRETADQISDKLKALTGEKGYVTRSST